MRNVSINSTFLTLIVILFVGGCTDKTDRISITDNLCVIQGDINGAVIESEGHNLVVYGDPENEISDAEIVLFTHARRDITWAAKTLITNGAKAVVPQNELNYFTKPDSVWNEIAKAQFHNYRLKSTKVPVKQIPVYRSVKGGDTILWRGIPIKVIGSRGYTEGAVSYMIHVDNKDIAFVGDLIYGDGKILDIYSLQDEVPELDVWAYHGYAARMADLIKSLKKIAAMDPDILIPSRGPVITNPGVAIPKLIHRLQLLYKNFLAINSYKWYRQNWSKIKDFQKKLEARVLPANIAVDYMPVAETSKNPSWLIPVENSKLIISEDGTGFLIDCGYKNAFDQFMHIEDNFSCSGIQGIFISHYHDDHTDYINKIRAKYDCPAYITKELKDILNNPGAYHMPAMTSEVITDLTVIPEGESINWKEFKLTFYYFPGQTIYHDAILVENNKTGEKVFMTGDSFSPTGIDDYCLQNINLLGDSLGYLYCINVLKDLPENCWLTNQHIKPAFRFTKEQLSIMSENLIERRNLLRDLFPWDNINYGIDDQWARFYPYSQDIKQDQRSATFSMVIYNHSPKEQDFTIRPDAGELTCTPEKLTIHIKPGQEEKASFRLNIPENITAGNRVITTDVSFGNKKLHKWCESIIKIKP